MSRSIEWKIKGYCAEDSNVKFSNEKERRGGRESSEYSRPGSAFLFSKKTWTCLWCGALYETQASVGLHSCSSISTSMSTSLCWVAQSVTNRTMV